MLSDQSLPIIEATLPLVGERMPGIAKNFYERLFAAHPELLDGLFSRANQKNGSQQQALAGSVAGFAAHLVRHPETYPEVMLSRIAHKHASLGIAPEQYDVVYKYLFEAIAHELSDVITSEIAAAWSEVYWLMAHALIKIETGLYAEQANTQPWSSWTVVAKQSAGTAAMTFTLEPADDTPVTLAKPGQFVSVRVQLADGLRQVRQYSLSAETSSRRRVFTTKRDDNGEVSPVLYNDVAVGDVIEVSNPYGDVTLADGNAPLVLATAGIGCTPSASILRSLVERGSEREVLVLHAERSLDQWALKDQMNADVDALTGARLTLWLENPTGTAHPGFMSLKGLDIPDGASVYLCGPLPFMKNIRAEALAAGVPADRIHYEVFGPDLWMNSAN
ncbi:hemin transporter [Arthrobacter sp. Soil782]|uniref:globin domain-containing protein n=1 Tax=Arthrobacter sp. Soil782 TaxID=1736410 RepID=UPI0006FB40FF|nr:globin domain-containing protein [Arthrobacter sp. Soil782]KRF09207.1 hemin transporter [Arthrobacter sp. Soil782]